VPPWPAFLLRWGLISFLPRLASNQDSPDDPSWVAEIIGVRHCAHLCARFLKFSNGVFITDSV
jgi:hypothetical protein